MNRLRKLTVPFMLCLAGCASVRAPGDIGAVWHGKDSPRLEAQLRYASGPLPEGWLRKVIASDAAGSLAYRKRSGTYGYSEAGYFAVDPKWRSEANYFGLLKPGNMLCVLNPEMQGEAQGEGVTTHRVYDYCAQLQAK